MKKMVIITPHLSTGGCPQFVLKKIELLQFNYELYCIEYNYLSPDYVVQRNKIKDIIGNKFKSIQEHNTTIKDCINEIEPDIIWLEEFPETFMNEDECNFIFSKERGWKILETTHSSRDSRKELKYAPDKFMFVSEFSQNMYKDLEIDSSVIQYPVDKKIRYQNGSKQMLSFDKEYKHVLNVGLFTPGKNQGYAFKLAEILKNEKIMFHFIGNLAGNFEYYWAPLLKNKPENCIIHGEKDNVEEYIHASDLFLFTSTFELNPLVIKEALCYEDLPILMFNLETYCNQYNNKENIKFLSGNVDSDASLLIRTLLENE
jgi:glycosyltransferase involved in cell wall biosynthesis